MQNLTARRSIGVAPGFKGDLDSHSLAVTAGERGLRATNEIPATSAGAVEVAGTGLVWGGRRGGTPRTAGARRPAKPQPVVALREGKHYPGLFASDHERAYARALEQLRRDSVPEALVLLEDVTEAEVQDEAIAARLVSAVARYRAGEYAAAVAHLEPIVSTERPREADPLIDRYELPAGYREFDVPIRQLDAPGGVVGLGPVFLLVSAYDALDRTKEAVGVMQKLISGREVEIIPAFVLIVLCELYQALDDWDEIVNLLGDQEIRGSDAAALALRHALATARSGLDGSSAIS